MSSFYKHLSLIVLVILIATFWERSATSLSHNEKSYDLLITNARIIDGSGNPWFRADIGIKDGRIVSIGRIASSTASKTIDAANQIVAPGFIDVHAHVESIYSLPAAENFVRMGVTTLVTGNSVGDKLALVAHVSRVNPSVP